MSADPYLGQRIVTGEAVAVDLRTAGIGSRGVALLLDLGVQFVFTIGWVWAISQTFSSIDSGAASAIGLALFVLTVLGYPVLFEALWGGRTLGHAAMGLRAVRDDGGPLRFRHAFVRGLVGVVLDRPGLSLGLLALIPMMSTTRSKRLGDLAAGTVVVQERVPAKLLAAPALPPTLAGWAAALDLTRLDDGLALRTRQFLGRAHQLAPWAREQMGSAVLDDVVAAVGPVPAGLDSWTYLGAVLAERSRREAARLSPPQAQSQLAAAPPPVARARPPDEATPQGPFAPPA